MLLKEALEDYICDCIVRRICPRTYKTYRNNINSFIRFMETEFEITKIEEIEKHHLKKYMGYLNNKMYKPSYVKNIYKANQLLFNYLVEEEYLKESIFANVKAPKNHQTIIQTFNDDEIRRMLTVDSSEYEYINVRNKTILLLLIDTGMRNQEVCQLLSSDLRGETIRIFGKGNKERYVAITPILRKQMTKYDRVKANYMRDKIVKCENYFVSQTQRPLTDEAIGRAIAKIGIKAKVRKEIRCSPHTFRHYFAQTQAKNGLDLFSLARILGHHNISITHRYLQSMGNENILKKSIATSPLQNL